MFVNKMVQLAGDGRATALRLRVNIPFDEYTPVHVLSMCLIVMCELILESLILMCDRPMIENVPKYPVGGYLAGGCH